MQCDLPYDTRSLCVELPDGVRVVGDRFPAALPDHAGAVRRALGDPVDSAPLESLVPRTGRVTVLIPDITRGSCLTTALGEVLSLVERAGAGPDRVEVILATGTHRGHSREELANHLGRDIVSRWTVMEHDARDEAALVEVGTTPAGTPCLFNERVVSAALVVCLGTVSFHYFAGFGGGRKLLLPGVAGMRTILANHRLSLEADPGEGLAAGCGPGRLEGNPVHRDMLAGAGLLPVPVFCVNTIFDDSASLLFVNAGDLDRSHRDAAAAFRGIFAVPFDRPYGAVVLSAGGYPKDINLLQSHKAIRHGSYALRDGGVMLAAAACREGVGSPSLREVFTGGPNGVPDTVRRGYTLNAQTAVSIHMLIDRYDIHLASELDGGEAARFGFLPWRDTDPSGILADMEPGEILVIMNASLFLPQQTGDA